MGNNESSLNHYFQVDENNNEIASNSQAHLLNEQTIDWLSLCCVLPKYGFPVDVITLFPHKSDSFAKNIKLERDMRIGLFEYAPGQRVIADKRIYKSEAPIYFLSKVHTKTSLDSTVKHFCRSCEEIKELSQANITKRCDSCQTSDLLELKTPDAFRSAPSQFALRWTHTSKGIPFVYFDRRYCDVKSTISNELTILEPENKTLTFINLGHGARGYEDCSGSKCAFSHDIITTIAWWQYVPKHLLFDNGNRMLDACFSVLYALRYAIAFELNVATQEIGLLPIKKYANTN